MFGLCDCNNFYASCERVFRPDLMGRPVVVLSNNDGCIIARSNEAKALGIGMGQPFFQARPTIERYGVEVFSANFSLYGDLSRRVMATLRQQVPALEIYSIDEAFFDLRGVDGPLDEMGRRIGRTIRQNTGIPVSIGIAPTKTLAKVAARLAKRYPKLRGCCLMYRRQDIDKVLKTFPLRDVWGIGRRYGRMFDRMNVQTAAEFVALPEAWVQRRMGITGLRTWRELQGTSCIGIEDPVAQQQICVSRTFPKELCALEELNPVVAEFAATCAAKLRKRASVCRTVRIFIGINRHREEAPRDFSSAQTVLAEASSDTPLIAKQARALLREVFRAGYAYKRAGVILSDIGPADRMQQALFVSADDRDRRQRLMETMDRINVAYGRGKLKTAAEGTAPFAMNRNHLSPSYTTDWNDLLVVKAK